MNNGNDIDSIKNIFVPNRQCIINTDLDGLLAGMLLQKFLNWKVVGFSSCNGKTTDDLWIMNNEQNIKDCVFVDLPVCVKTFFVVDQHFVSIDEEENEKFRNDINKINPNIIRNKVFKDKEGKNHYTEKYPFGTFHFVLAVLERLNIIDDSYILEVNKKIENFTLADLVLRADRVIGNTCSYTPNCLDWADWIISIGKTNTKKLFDIVKQEYNARRIPEKKVEEKLISLGCIGYDGDCSNMFRSKNINMINNYFRFLSESVNLDPIHITNFNDFNILDGTRYEVNNYNLEGLKNEVQNTKMFSFAFVTMKTLSVTYIMEEENNE